MAGHEYRLIHGKNSGAPGSGRIMVGGFAFMRIFSLILVLALMSGCQHPPASGSHPTKLAGLIAGADSIVITYRLPPWDHAVPPPERYRGFSLAISGDETRKIVMAVSTAEQSGGFTDSVFPWDLKFYRETQLLVEIHLQGSHFMFEAVEFQDGRVLEHLDEDLYKRTTPPNEK